MILNRCGWYASRWQNGIRLTRNQAMVLSDLGVLAQVNLPVGIEVRPVISEHFRAIYDVYADAYSTFQMAHKADEHAFQDFVTYELAGDT